MASRFWCTPLLDYSTQLLVKRFNVLIGSVTPLPLPFDVPYWLGVTLGITDAEITPRQTIAASAYTIRSASTESLASTATVPAAQVTGTVSNAANFTGTLAGDVTGTQGATTISPAIVTGKALTGFVSAAGTISASDSMLTAFNKLNGNAALKAPLASPQFTGSVGIGTAGSGSPLTVAGVIESTSGGIKFPDGATQTKALANCSAEGDVAVMHSGAWVCRSTLVM